MSGHATSCPFTSPGKSSASSGVVTAAAAQSWAHVRHARQEHLELHQTDQARTDFAAIESDLQFINGQFALPTCAYLFRTLLLATTSVWALLAALLLIR
jgi:hypothetical protein